MRMMLMRNEKWTECQCQTLWQLRAPLIVDLYCCWLFLQSCWRIRPRIGNDEWHSIVHDSRLAFAEGEGKTWGLCDKLSDVSDAFNGNDDDAVNNGGVHKDNDDFNNALVLEWAAMMILLLLAFWLLLLSPTNRRWEAIEEIDEPEEIWWRLCWWRW